MSGNPTYGDLSSTGFGMGNLVPSKVARSLSRDNGLPSNLHSIPPPSCSSKTKT